MIEAELKARVADPEALRARLRRLADEENSVYHDTYYDTRARELTASGRELRVRVVDSADGARRTVLTYKEPPADVDSGSKPEHETTVADAAVLDVIFRAIGTVRLVAFEKHCANYRFTANGRDMLAAALADIRAVLGELGITEADLTTEEYTDAVIRARA